MNTTQATDTLKNAANMLVYTVRRVIEETQKETIDTAAMKEHLSAVAKSLILANASNAELKAAREAADPESFFREEPATCHELRSK